MLTQKHIEEIRSKIEKSENPIFFYDDDPDGLCSFLLFMRKYQKGKGVCVKAGTKDPSIYLSKVEEYHPDAVFVFDKPFLPEEFIQKVHVPIIWIDHHPPQKIRKANYYNPLSHAPYDNRPTTYWSYQVTEEDLWIALIGIAADYEVPDKELLENNKYKDLLPQKLNPENILYESNLGKLVKIFNFATKGKTPEVKKAVSCLLKVKTPEEILKQTTEAGRMLYDHYEHVNKEYTTLLNKALSTESTGEIFLFLYAEGKISLTSSLSNELMYRINKPVIIVGRLRGDIYRLSLRSKTLNIASMIKNALSTIDGFGGGHEHACGAMIKRKDLEKFIGLLRSQISS